MQEGAEAPGDVVRLRLTVGAVGARSGGPDFEGAARPVHVSVLPLSSCSSFPPTDCRNDELHASVALRDRRAAAGAAA